MSEEIRRADRTSTETQKDSFIRLCENMIRKTVDVVDDKGDRNYSLPFDYDTLGRALYTNQIDV